VNNHHRRLQLVPKLATRIDPLADLLRLVLVATDETLRECVEHYENRAYRDLRTDLSRNLWTVEPVKLRGFEDEERTRDLRQRTRQLAVTGPQQRDVRANYRITGGLVNSTPDGTIDGPREPRMRDGVRSTRILTSAYHLGR
jgi:hypothetical protein